MAKITDKYGNVIGEIREDTGGPGCLYTIFSIVFWIVVLLIILNCCA